MMQTPDPLSGVKDLLPQLQECCQQRLQLSAIFSTASIEENYLVSGVPCSHGNRQPMLVKRTRVYFCYFPISNLLPMECTITVAWALEKECVS